MKTIFVKSLRIIPILIIIFFTTIQCSRTEDDSPNNSPPTNTVTTSGQYLLSGQTFNCTCITDGKGYVFLTDKNNSKNSFGIDKMPSSSSGTFNFGKNFTGNTTSSMGYLLDSRSDYNGYGTLSGTITKTALNKFTFQCILYNPLTAITYPISGSGEY